MPLLHDTEERIYMSKIKDAFRNGRAFIPFITCGYPSIEETEKIVIEAVKNGADIIELGIPFSDPTAEGDVVQGANVCALSNGITTDDIFKFVSELRKKVTVPIVFMTYANVVFSYGAEKFIGSCAELGVDGIILTDLPFEEKDEFLPVCRKYGVELISAIAPTSRERTAMIAKDAEGFVYIACGSYTPKLADDLSTIVRVVRENTDIPCVIGINDPTPEMAGEMAGISDGIIAGSEIIKLIEKHRDNSAEIVGEYVKSMKNAS